MFFYASVWLLYLCYLNACTTIFSMHFKNNEFLDSFIFLILRMLFFLYFTWNSSHFNPLFNFINFSLIVFYLKSVIFVVKTIIIKYNDALCGSDTELYNRVAASHFSNSKTLLKIESMQYLCGRFSFFVNKDNAYKTPHTK